MNALIYLTKRTIINHLKQAVKKPLTLFLVIFGAAYACMALFGFHIIIQELHISSVTGLVVVITFWTLYTFISKR